MKFHISYNDHKNISHNIIQGHPFLTMNATTKVNPHKIQWLTTNAMCVTTLTLGSWLRQGAWKGKGQECNLKVTFTLLGVRKNVKEWTHTLPSGFPLWELASKKTLESLKSNLNGQNSLDWKFPYAIGKLLRLVCLKLVCMIHLSTYNTSYGRKKVWNSKCQFDLLTIKS
jgi:hypothetical protein